MRSTLGTRLRRLYENTPLPADQAVGMAVEMLLSRLRPAPMPGPRPLLRTAGAGLGLLGGGLIAWAMSERRRRSRGRFDLEHPDELVTTGPYAFTRHPMYVGWWLVHLGAGLYRGSSWSLVTLPAALLVEHPGVLREEAMLRELFGQAYQEYAAVVPRYIGLGKDPRTVV